MDEDRTKEQLIADLAELRLRVAELEEAEGESRTCLRALEESEARMKFVTEQVGDFIWQLGLDFHFTFVSGSVRRIGYEPEDLIGEHLFSFLTPESIETVIAQKTQLDALAATGNRTTDLIFEVNFLAKDGSTVPSEVLVSFYLGEEGVPVSYQGVARDIRRRNEAEEALKESERKFRLLFEKSADPILLLDGDTFIDCNEAAVKLMHAVHKNQLVGLTPCDISPERQPDDRLSTEKARELGEITHKEGVNRFEWMRRAFNGDEFWVEVSQTVIPIGGKQIMYTVWKDIRERKKNEIELRESEERYRVAIENSNDGVVIAREGKAIYVNKRYLTMFGYSIPEEVIGTSVFSVVHPDDQAMVMEYDRRWQRNEPVPSRYEFKGMKRDGTVIYVEASLVQIPYLGGPAFLAYLRDTTDRRLAEEALRATTARLLRAGQVSRSGNWELDLDTKRIFASEGAMRIYGLDRSEMPLEMVQYAPLPEYRSLLDDSLKALVENRAVYDVEFKIRRPDNGKIVPIRSVAEYDPERRTVFGVIQDITDRKRAEEERAKLESQLRQAQKMQAIGQLAGGVAHDFNNILTVIVGFVTLVRMALDEHRPVDREHIDQLLAASRKAANLTHSLLAFSRKQRIDLRQQSINELVAGTGKLLERLLTEDIELRIDLAEREPTIMADVTQMDQVLINLVTNARDAMPRGGSLLIETGEAEIDDRFRRAYGFGEPGRYVVLTVSDNGIGMDEATVERIFEPFFTTKEVGKGTGLGLSTVYGIVKQHDGYILVSSQPGRGTTIRIYLPEVSAGTQQKAVSAELRGGTETILVAEDDSAVRKLAIEILRASNYRTLEAADGEEAERVFSENRDNVDLIIMDVVMPKKSGKEAYSEIQKKCPNARVIFMSGYTRDVVLDKGIEDEKVDFIAKPLTPDTLLAKVRKVLDR
jgi:two-component system, cell cycle sensor histidine kinase and response regulator CckA